MATDLSTQVLPTATPAETIDISPEALETANCYLQNPSIQAVAAELDISTELVTQILSRREVKAYIDQVYYNIGFNNRFKLGSAMDAIIERKFRDLDEADTGSTKDISELLALKHKMIMEHMAHELAMAKITAGPIKSQTNVQINDNSGKSNYSSLISRLINNETIDA